MKQEKIIDTLERYQTLLQMRPLVGVVATPHATAILLVPRASKAALARPTAPDHALAVPSPPTTGGGVMDLVGLAPTPTIAGSARNLATQLKTVGTDLMRMIRPLKKMTRWLRLPMDHDIFDSDQCTTMHHLYSTEWTNYLSTLLDSLHPRYINLKV